MTKSITDIAREAGLNDFGVAWQMDALERFAAAIKAAHLEELASVGMPEPVALVSHAGGSSSVSFKHRDIASLPDRAHLVTLDQCQQAVAAAVATNEQLRDQNTSLDAACAKLEAERDALRDELERRNSAAEDRRFE